MATEDNAIVVKNVDKQFLLPHEKNTTVKSMFTSLFRNSFGGKSSYERQQALNDVSFEVKKGEFFGIVGRNGSGKSTLLKMIAGIYQPTIGQIQVNGRLVPFIELGVGFNPELTGRENVYLNGALLGFSEEEVTEMYQDVVEFAELERFMDQKLKNYSSGMQVRLAFSMAIRADADILLIDEVLAVGDADFQRKCYEYFKSLKRNNKTVVFVSHDMDAIREYCDRALLINESRISTIGQVEYIAQEYTKLFMDGPIKSDPATSEKERWGSKEIQTTTVELEVTESNVLIKQEVEARSEVKDVIFGIRINTSTGQAIVGTNTKIEGVEMTELGKGGSLAICWSIPQIFVDGEYDIDLAITKGDGATVYDWWNKCTAFNVRRQRRVPYVVDPGFSIDISQLDKSRDRS